MCYMRPRLDLCRGPFKTLSDQRKQYFRIPEFTGGGTGRPGEALIYAASSSTYGDHPGLPKVESVIGRPLSPYAVTKYVNELYADVFARCYGVESVGLRYFNVFGPRQDPNGAYAAVIPQWIAALIRNQTLYINGDGETSRDFCFIENVVQANLLAALAENPEAVNQIYNVAVNERTSLNQLYEMMRALLLEKFPILQNHKPDVRGFSQGRCTAFPGGYFQGGQNVGF